MWFTTKVDQKYVHQMLVVHNWILKSWLAILNPQSSTLNFEISILYSPSSYLNYPNLNSPFSNSTSSTLSEKYGIFN